MIPSFRNAIMEVDDPNGKTSAKEDNILLQLKCIFYAMSESEKQYFNPKGFCHAFKDYDGNPTNVFEQMDADEFFNMFMDRLEGLIKGTKQENVIKQHFGGVLSNEFICKGCPHYSEREESFINVNLQVKNKKSILQSLSSFVEGEMLEGDNAYQCNECNKKVNTLKRACLKRLPNNLIMVLKRFEFDYDIMAKVKVNDYCEFPTKLNMEPYTQQGLRKAEKLKTSANSQQNAANQEDTQQQTSEKEYPQSYFEYKLVGIVIHLGVADSGHYYSLIQDRELPDVSDDRKWYEFNDTIVKHFDAKDIPNEAYGGEEKWRYYQVTDNTPSIISSLKEKIRNAYLLFYERIEPYEEEVANPVKIPEAPKEVKKEDAKEDDKEGKTSKGKSQNKEKGKNLKDADTPLANISAFATEVEPSSAIPEEFLRNLREDNTKFHIHKNIFSKDHEYFEFILDLFFQRSFIPNLNYNENGYEISVKVQPKEYRDFDLIRMSLTFLLTTVLREKSRYGIIKLLPAVKRALHDNIPACQWILDVFTSKRILTEFLLDCTISDMRKFVVGILMVAFRKIYPFEGKGAANRLMETDKKTGLPVTRLANFINACIQLIFETKQGSREFTDFFKIFYEIARTGPEPTGYLIHHKVIGRLMDFFYDGMSPLNEFFRNMSDVPYKESGDLIGFCHEEKKKHRTTLDEILAKRKERAMPEHHSAHRTFLWQSVSYLITFCKISKSPKRCPWQIGDYDYEVVSEERTLLTPEFIFITKAIDDATHKIAYRAIGKLYSYLAYEDAKFTTILLNALKQGFTEKDHSVYRQYFRCFYNFMLLKDSLEEQRLNELCGMFAKSFHENSNYYMETDMMSSFFLKMVGRVEGFRNYFMKQPDTWTWIINWLSQYPSPPLGMPQSPIKLQKKRAGVPCWKYAIQEYKSISQLKLQKFKRLAKGEPELLTDKWDSDNDLGDHEFQLSEKLDYHDNHHQKWVTAEVDSILEEMIRINCISEDKEIPPTWLSKECDGLAPFETMQVVQEQIEKESERIELSEKLAAAGAGGNQNDPETDPEAEYQKIMDSDPGDSSSDNA
jgi:hypothetical protein